MSEQCAYHEAGHALMAHLCGARVHFVSIDPEWEPEALRADGEIELEWENETFNPKERLVAQIRVALAGPAAEMIYSRDPFHPAFVHEWKLDWNTAWELAGALHVDEKKRLRFLEKQTQELYHYLAQDFIWQAIASLVDELLAHEHLEGDLVHEVLATWLPS
ncbi:MAG: site-2 protease family protein [Planctomycetota bacterium]